MNITNRPDRIVVDKWPKHNDVVTYAIQAYAFLIPYHQTVSAAGLADLIAQYYDETEPRNAAVIAALRAYERPITPGPQEPPQDERIYNRRQADGTYRPLAGFFDRKG